MSSLVVNSTGVTNADCTATLGNPFNTTYYVECVISTTNYGTGNIGPSRPSSVGSVSAPSPEFNTAPSVSISVSGLSAGSNTSLYSYAKTPGDGNYWFVGSATAATFPGVPTVVSAYASGLSVTASWNVGAGTSYSEVNYSWGLTNTPIYSSVNNATAPSYNTTYTVQVRCVGANGNFSAWVSTTVTTTKPVLASPSYLSYSSTVNTLTTNFGSVTNANKYYFTIHLINNTVVASGNNTTPSFTFSGLTGNTAYYVSCYASDTTATYTDSDLTYSPNLTTQSAGPLPTPSAPSVTPKYTSSVASWSVISGATGYTVYLYDSIGSLISTLSSSSTTKTITGLVVSTSYRVAIKALGDNGQTGSDSGISSQTFFATLSNPSAPEFITSSTVKSSTSVQLFWTTIIDAIYTLQYKRDVDVTWITWSSALSSSNTTVTGLTTGTLYDFKVKAIITETGYDTGYGGIVLATPGFRPVNFDWTVSKTAGATVVVTAVEWNNFATKIRDFQTYKALSPLSSFTTVNTTMDISASIMQEAITGINRMIPPTATPASPTSMVTDISAAFLNTLRDSLNSIV